MAADGRIVVDATIDTKGFKAGSQEMLRAVTSFGQSISNLRKAITSPMKYFVDSVRQGAKESARLEGEMRRLTAEANRLKSQLNDQPVETSQYKALQAEIAKTDAALLRLTAKQRQMKDAGVSEGSKQWQSLEQQIDSIVNKYNTLNQNREMMERNGTAYTGGRGSQEYDEQVQKINAVIGRLQELRAQRNAALNVPDMIAGGLLAILGQIAVKAGNAAVSLAKMAATRAIGALKNLAVSAKNAALHLGKLAVNAAVSTLKRIGSAALSAGKSLLNLGRSQKSLNGGFSMGFKNILRYAFGIRSLFALFNRLRGAIVDAFGAMAKQFPEVNSTISKLQSQLNALKGNLGAAFEPVLTAVAPYLSQLIGYLNTAMTSVSKFFAMLTGQSYYLRAKEVQTDYAKSLDKTTKATKATTKATKDAENQLASFDALNILSGNKDSGSSGGGDGGAQSAADSATQEFEKVPLTGISDWLQRLKDAINAGDYDGVGRALADKINSIFESLDELISWDNVGDKITSVITAITTAFNGLVDGINWERIGNVVGHGINTIIYSLNLLLSGINWKALGTALAKGLNGLFDGVDWDALGRFGANRLNSVWETLYGVVTTFKWGQAGRKFADAISSLISEADFEALKKGIIGAANGVIEALQELVSHFKWGQYGVNFGDAVNTLVDEINTDKLGGLLADEIGEALKFLYNAVSTLEWGRAGAKFAGALNEFFKRKHLWTLAGLTITKAMKGILDFTQQTFITFDEIAFAHDIRELLANVDWPGIASSTWETIKTVFKKTGNFLNVLFADESEMHYDPWERMYVPDSSKSLGARIGTALEKVFNAGIKLIKAEEISDALNWVLINAIDFSQALVDTFDSDEFRTKFEKALRGVKWNEIGKSFLHLLGSGIVATGEALPFIGPLVTEMKLAFSGESDEFAKVLIEGLGDSFSKVASFSGKKGDDIAGNFFEGFKAKVVKNGRIKDEFKDVISEIFTPAEIEALESGDMAVMQFYYALGKGGLDEKGNVTKQLSSLISDITGDAAQAATTGGYQAADNFTMAYIVQTLAKQSDAETAVDSAFNEIWAGLNADGNGEQVASDYFEAFDRTVKDSSGHVKDEFRDVVIMMFGSVEAYENGGMGASDFLYGLIDGIAHSKGETIGQMASLVGEITSGSAEGAETGGQSVADKFTSAYILETLLRQKDATNAVDGAFNEIWNAINADGNGEQTAKGYLKAFNDTVLNENGTVKENFIGVIQGMFGSVGAYNYGDVDGKDFLKGLIQGMYNTSGDTSAKLVNIIDGILESIRTDPDGMDEHSPSKRAAKWGVDFLKGFGKGVDSEEGKTTSSVKTAFSTITDVAFAMTAMTLAVSLGMIAVKLAFTTGLTQSKTAIDTSLTSIVSGVQTKVDTITQNTSKSMNTIKANISTNMFVVQSTVNNSLNMVDQSVNRSFTNMGNTAQSKLLSMQNRVQMVLQNMVGDFDTQGQRMHNALSNKLDTVIYTAQSKMNTAYYRMNNVSFAGVGRNIANGIVAGINSRWSYVHDYVWRFAQSLLYNARRSLGIHSPSRVFRDEIGKNISLGIAEGITENESAAIASINGISDAMVSQMKKMDALETSVAFKTPDIAVGSVLPYNVTASITGANEGIRETLEANNADISDTVIQAVNNATIAIVRAIETYSTTNVNIDKRSLTDVLVEEINRRTRAQGSSPLLG